MRFGELGVEFGCDDAQRRAGAQQEARFAYRDFAAANPKAVEPPINVGGWYFKDAGAGVDITYLICTDAGGSIPYAIQNAATKKTLPDTVGDVVREAKKRLGKD